MSLGLVLALLLALAAAAHAQVAEALRHAVTATVCAGLSDFSGWPKEACRMTCESCIADGCAHAAHSASIMPAVVDTHLWHFAHALFSL